MLKRLMKSKTAWTAVGGILVAAGSWMAGEIEARAAVEAVFLGLTALFLRDGIAKGK